MSKRNKGNKAESEATESEATESEATDVHALTMRDVIIEASDVQLEIDLSQDQISTLRGGVSQHLLLVAQGIPACNEEGKDASAIFEAACSVDETYIKSDDAGKHKVDRLPRCWTQAKSNIKAAYNFSMDLSKFTTEKSMRKELNDLRKARSVEEGHDALAQAIDASVEIDTRLTASINALMIALRDVTEPETIDEIIDTLDEATASIHSLLEQLVPKEPVEDDVEEDQEAVG